MKTLILGLGNPILSDDSVGLRVARALEGRLNEQGVTVMETSVVGLGLLDLLTGYDRAIIIDAIQTVGGKAGQIYRLAPDAFHFTRHAAPPHDVNLATALELGSRLGLALPRQIVIFAIEVADASTFGEECTPEVMRAIPVCAEMVVEELNGNHISST
ncbi:MAG TPA: hydrogenase maturation protease [Dehalococcoidia bacterium]|jgi:hydrogenase maturation protease|nr:hydrogenase maturation protease [Dehalococcoidia bacterium]